MNLRKLGRSGLPVSELCLGTMNFGWTIDRPTALQVLDAYREAGGSFIQAVSVCPGYAALTESMTAPEEWIGYWMRARKIPRQEVVLASRITLNPARTSISSLTNAIRHCCEDSLRRLGSGYLDLLLLDWTKPPLPTDPVLQAFDMLIAAGFVRQVAAANFPVWRVMEAIARANARNRSRYESLQVDLSVHTPPAVTEDLFDLCNEYRLGLLATTGRFHVDAGAQYTERAPARESSTPFAEDLSPAARAVAWSLSHPQVSSVVICAGSLREIQDLCQAASLISRGWSSEDAQASCSLHANSGCTQTATAAIGSSQIPTH
jgi:aryl-alcohol dehydrogenase-like predicted oxidoreductase